MKKHIIALPNQQNKEQAVEQLRGFIEEGKKGKGVALSKLSIPQIIKSAEKKASI